MLEGMAEKLLNAIQVVNVDTGMSYIRHVQCVRADEVVTSTSVQFTTERTGPYICGLCGEEIPLHQTGATNRESGAFGGILDQNK